MVHPKKVRMNDAIRTAMNSSDPPVVRT